MQPPPVLSLGTGVDEAIVKVAVTVASWVSEQSVP